MLAPLAETRERSPLLDLGIESLGIYPAFVDELAEVSGSDVEIQGPGMIRLARTEKDLVLLHSLYDWQQGLGVPLERLSCEEVARLEPALGSEQVGGLLSPLERHIAPRRLLLALCRAAAAGGVWLKAHSPVEGFVAHGGRVNAVETPAGVVSCRELLLAGGAWNGGLASRLHLEIPISPIRGQVVSIACAGVLKHTIYTHQGYLVPRESGELIAGATEDEAGFNCYPTAEGVKAILDFATSVVPALGSAPFDGACAGLRPVTPDRLPVLGSIPGWDNAHVAGGHFRNGVLLAPVTASRMAGWILERKTWEGMDGVSAERFGNEA
jgi:glycine oxidase